MKFFLTFPHFSSYSTILLFLALQGVIFGVLLVRRFIKKKNLSDLLLALLLFITCYHRTTFIIGFMDWYDTYRNTKINYYLISMTLAVGPLIYFYVRSVTTAGFKWKKAYFIHFIPAAIYGVYRIFLLLYDSMQPGYNEVQNGVLMKGLNMPYISTFMNLMYLFSMTLYLAFSIQAFLRYRRKLKHFYSNTYRYEMIWLASFLGVYTFLFGYFVIQNAIDSSITNLHWTTLWWYHFLSALVIVYVGIRGFFTETTKLHDVRFSRTQDYAVGDVLMEEEIRDEDRDRILGFIADKKPYLDPFLTVAQMAKEMNIPSNQLSYLINTGFSMNFNDFINQYRVKAFNNEVEQGKHKQYSLLAIAMECGFNSKATFNRVYKKVMGISPSEYAKKSDN